jgi:hypothetical protein
LIAPRSKRAWVSYPLGCVERDGIEGGGEEGIEDGIEGGGGEGVEILIGDELNAQPVGSNTATSAPADRIIFLLFLAFMDRAFRLSGSPLSVSVLIVNPYVPISEQA